MSLSPRFIAVTVCTMGFGLALTFGCEPRKKANTGGTTAAATATPTPAATTAAPTATPTATATAAPTPTPTATAAPTPTPAPTGAWPTSPMPGLDPNVVAEWAKKAQEMGIPLPGGTVPGATPAGDPIEAALKASAAKHGPGYTAASPIGRATVKQGEHAGMNFNMQQGKCYIVVAAAGPGVTQLSLHLLFPATPPNAAIASDTSATTAPVLGGGGKPLCPPVASSVRIDTVATAGAGNVGVQVWVK
jgi:hypothetical protein